MIDNILIGGHEAEMAALEELDRSDEMRLLSRQLAARDLRGLAKDRNISDTVRSRASRLYTMKTS